METSDRCAGYWRSLCVHSAPGTRELYVPRENVREAALIDGLAVYGVSTLTELIEHLTPAEDEPKDDQFEEDAPTRRADPTASRTSERPSPQSRHSTRPTSPTSVGKPQQNAA
jgi:predicted ATPase with chaperone activity